MKQREYLIVSIAHNDRNGNPSGKAGLIQIGDMLTFEPDNMAGETFTPAIRRHKAMRFRVNRREFPYAFEHDWYGSMAYSGFKMHYLHALALANYLHQTGKWSLTEGVAEMWDALDRGEAILPGDFLRVLNESEPESELTG